MKNSSFTKKIYYVLFCFIIPTHSATVAVFDPFSSYFEQFRKDISFYTNAKTVRVDSLSDSILPYSTLFLFLAEGNNQQKKFEQYTLDKKEQELLIQYLMEDKNLHIFAQPFYKSSLKEDNPLFSYLKISFAGSKTIRLAIDSAIGSGTALFKENIDRFQIIRKDTLKEGIFWPHSPVINAEKATCILTGCGDSSCDKSASWGPCLSYLFDTECGKAVIDLFHFLDYKPYLKTLCKFYDIPVKIKNDVLFESIDRKEHIIKSTIILNKKGTLNFNSFYDKSFEEVFLVGLNGRLYYHYTGNKQASRKINISNLSPAFYLSIHRK